LYWFSCSEFAVALFKLAVCMANR